MASLLAKKSTPLNRMFPSCRHHNLTFLTPLFHFSTQIQQKDDLPFIAQYLISSFGFSQDRAIRASVSKSKLSPIKTADQPDSVVRFLKDNQLTDKEIKSLISWNPDLLCTSVERILKPRINEMKSAGFGGNIFIELIKNNPSALNRRTTLPILQFWKKFVDNNEESLLKVIKCNPGLMNTDINKKVVPRMNLLREYGLSDQQIDILLMRRGSLLLRDSDTIKLFLEKIENLGFQRGSGMFARALEMISCLKEGTIERKINFLRSTYNWSDEDVNLAIKKCPQVVTVSEEKLKSIMDFLVRKVGCDPRSVVMQPVILTLSFNKRVMPRHYVVKILKSKGLKINCSFKSVIMMPEKMFVEKLIVPYKKELPDLEDSYKALCNGEMPT